MAGSQNVDIKFSDVGADYFKTTRLWTILSYTVTVYGFNILKVAFFISDIYTCIKLLAFDSWSNNIIKPYLSFRMSKWLFSGCILLSIALLLRESFVGIRLYRSKKICLAYMNNFARNLYSILDFSKFCLFEEISTENKFQKLAFFVFFELDNCLRLLFADSPRQVINGLTLWSVLVTVNDDADLADLEPFSTLLKKIKAISETNKEETMLLSFMLFSFIIWLFFFAKFVLAVVASVYVYYKLVNEQQGLKKYVYATISSHLDRLVAGPRRSRRILDELQTPLIIPSTDSLLEMKNFDSTTKLPTEYHLEICDNDDYDDDISSSILEPARTSSVIDSNTNRHNTQDISSFNNRKNYTNLKISIHNPTRPKPRNDRHIYTPVRAYVRHLDRSKSTDKF